MRTKGWISGHCRKKKKELWATIRHSGLITIYILNFKRKNKSIGRESLKKLQRAKPYCHPDFFLRLLSLEKKLNKLTP
jgi:hypothetical protein